MDELYERENRSPFWFNSRLLTSAFHRKQDEITKTKLKETLSILESEPIRQTIYG